VRAPHRTALTCDGVTWNYGELQQRIERLSAVFAAGGVRTVRGLGGQGGGF
jgi:non-ribosomal peptide synthetase component E (peptide arylation enzyme)